MLALHRAFKREHRLKLLASLALLAFGMVMVRLFFGQSAIVTAFGLLCGVLGIGFTVHLLSNWDEASNRLMVLLHLQPEQIVWVYSLVTEQMPFGFQFSRHGTLYFKLLDGDEITVGLRASQLKPVSEYLNDRLPHATFGYTRDREQWYLANPAMLLRDV